ncbi:MAG: hypothetical protein ABUS57_21025 [Pseudomonadota bacterium]
MASRYDWGAIFAGAVLATALGLILITFGAGIGLSTTSPYSNSGMSPQIFAIVAGLWLLWTQILSFSLGGYVTARLRARHADESEHETDVRDGMHGIVMWGVGVLAAAFIAFVGLGGATTAVRTAERGEVVASAGTVAANKIDQAVAKEARENPDAAGSTQAEREAEISRKLSIIAAFMAAASLLAGAIAAFWAAGEGGNHRDKNVHVKFFVFRAATPRG